MIKLRLAILTLGAFVIGTELYIIAGILPHIAGAFTIGVPLAGQSVTVFALAYALGAPVLSNLLRRLERRQVLVLSMVGFAIANGLSALAPNFACLLACRVLSALCACLYLPNATVLAAGLGDPSRQGMRLGIVFAGLNIATVAGVPLGLGIDALAGWRAVFAMIAVLAGATALLVRVCLVPVQVPRALTSGDRFAALKQRGALPALAITVVVLTGFFTVFTYSAVLLRDRAGLDRASYSLALIVYGLSSIAGAWLGGLLSDRLGWRGPLRLVLGILVLIMLGFAASASHPFVPILLFLFWGLIGAAFTPIQQFRLLGFGIGPEIFALNSSAIYLGQTFAGILGAFVISLAGPDRLGPVAAICMLVGFSLTFMKSSRKAGA